MSTPVAEVSETKYARTADGLSIAYQTMGDGPRSIVCLLRGSCMEVMWEDPQFRQVMGRLARLGRVITFDWRGFGESDPVTLSAVPTPEAWADDFRAVLDAAGAERAVLLGDEPGGPIALLFAATHPERADALVLVDTYARILRDEDYEFGAPPEVLDSYVRFVESGWGSDRKRAALDVPSRADDETFLWWYTRLQRLAITPPAIGTLLRWVTSLDVRDVLPSVRLPTLVIHNDRNPSLSLAYGRYLADHIAGARLVVDRRSDNWMLSSTAGIQVVDAIAEFLTGVPPPPDPDRALTTVLFTDIVNSTEHAARLGDARWMQILADHDALVDRELRIHRGQKINPTGDGVVAMFDGPARAVRCGQAICSGVRRLGIEVRVGLHTGEVELRGGDIGGIAVHIGQRVSATAGPGEVLVSRTVTDLVAGSGIEFKDCGEHELKGVPGSWRLFAVED